MPRRVRHFCNFVSKGALMSRRALLSKLRMAGYPSNMAPFGLKLWQNSFQMIPNIWIFDAKKVLEEIFGTKNQRQIKNRSIWRSYEFLSVRMTFVSKSYPRCPKIQLSMTFGWGVKVVFFSWLLGQNWLALFWFADMIIWWYDDMMIWWYDGMIIWS